MVVISRRKAGRRAGDAEARQEARYILTEGGLHSTGSVQLRRIGHRLIPSTERKAHTAVGDSNVPVRLRAAVLSTGNVKNSFAGKENWLILAHAFGRRGAARQSIVG
ncbi:MAG TPA: hypothetical protein PKA30_06995 [Accumulibacter sp.]|uniref:hypothetical protein n=1 Tax=Accumulibacter sp. TaxID=2053492 RepID=UPI00287913BE|nr:hypothetical protein [Accumulibacter sp.]MDS4054256.1 hypothetical protein [Accumulibacter sp.]HMV05284.1 hypothetical protein [Accumulibacter sp.]HMW63875.1 hypothetical protein [Accumulibacter sp.]HMW80526.1 hypothetical protein [Accumulibacter sp.]HMX68954.1 hypothetical protein [Accumulibacter sp.]